MPLLFAALTNVFAWMGFSTMAMKYLAVSEGSLLVYTMPIWAMLFAWPILSDRPSWRDIVALSLGLSGVAVLLSAHGITLGPDKLIGIALALAAAILFALGGVMTKSPLPIPPTALVAWQVGLGCLPMIVFGLLFEHPNLSAISASGWAVLIYMALGPMGICYLAWFAALRRLPAATAAIGTLSVPIIGVIAAAVMLREPLGMREALAMALTLAGVHWHSKSQNPRCRTSNKAHASMSGLGLVSRVSPVQTALRNCTRDEGRSFEVGNQVLISSHRKLLLSKAMVVNVAEKSEQDSGRHD